MLSSEDYLQHIAFTETQQTSNEPRIGLIIADGSILDGYHDTDYIGGDTYADLIQRAAEEENLSALVIRVNSPGGSASAAELIRTPGQSMQ